MKNLITDTLNISTSLLATLVRTGAGISSTIAPVKPEISLILYDIESCPYCRVVREALTELDLDVTILPCPKRGERFRPEVIELGGKAQFPYLVDKNTGTQLYESLEIIDYLFSTYGQVSMPFKWKLGFIQLTGSKLASAARTGLGAKKRSSKQPAQLLELYSFESSPYARLVRECLCEMELPYLVRNCGRTELAEWLLPAVRDTLKIEPESMLLNRQKLLEKTGRMAIPYLVDPNTNVEMFESSDIIQYLQETYGQ